MIDAFALEIHITQSDKNTKSYATDSTNNNIHSLFQLTHYKGDDRFFEGRRSELELHLTVIADSILLADAGNDNFRFLDRSRNLVKLWNESEESDKQGWK